MALIAHAAALESRLPFLHFFDGFRTSHEVNKIEMLTEDDMQALINMDRVFEHRRGRCRRTIRCCAERRRTPTSFSRREERPTLFTTPAPRSCRRVMDKFASVVGRTYHLFDYVGAPDAERVIVMMGSGAEAAAGDGGVPELREAKRSGC